jgi:hypothetical protein
MTRGARKAPSLGGKVGILLFPGGFAQRAAAGQAQLGAPIP